jgi:WD40 repeat protein
VSSGDVLYRFSGHTASVTTLALAPDGDQFVSGDEDGVVKMWDLSAFVNDSQDADVEMQHEALRRF